MAVSIRRLVLDSLKPREISIIELSRVLCQVTGVEEVDITVTEVDAKTETIKLIIRGSNINYENLSKVMGEYGVAIRSIDEINVSKTKMVPQKK
ncbi:MAG: hypothetical protein DRO36_01890 [Candidatus Hecatellales archaeon]|nr:MAG: hypothetical protein DRO36_01890 [Candidatus Hecatellales archaeon]